MRKSSIKKIIVLSFLALAMAAHAVHAAEPTPNELYSVKGKVFTTKGAAIRYILTLNGERVQVLHTRCEILTNKMSFKACPKNSGTFENEQFAGLKGQ